MPIDRPVYYLKVSRKIVGVGSGGGGGGEEGKIRLIKSLFQNTGDLQNQSPAFFFSAKPPALMEKQMAKSSISIRAQLVTEAAHHEGSSIVVMFLTPCHIQFLQLSIIDI